MSDVAIKVENLGKKFIIGHKVDGDLRGSFAKEVSRLLGSANGQSKEEFWALKDVSFQIKQGDPIGIIGRNGAGKSTLLKILSRITEPSTGRFEINGRVSSLLEVGTGFHSELTGRENVYLNGTILGMRRAEIKKKFDAMVDFSGVEKFIDTPVKHYSSGMKVRLAFSVAAHLEPEILIIDEVLAVGDAEFQKKCLGKIDEVSKNEGRTVLFVSHNLTAVRSLCLTSVLLDQGKIKLIGDTTSVISEYISSYNSSRHIFNHKLNEDVYLKEFRFSTYKLEALSDIDITLCLESNAINPVSGLALLFYNSFQERIAIVDLRSDGLFIHTKTKMQITAEIKVKDLPFIEGDYNIGLYVKSNLFTGNIFDIVRLSVHSRIHTSIAPYPLQVRGTMELKYEFDIK